MLEPWQVIGSTISYEDPWLKIESDQCLTKTGRLIEPYHVIQYPTWVNAVALTSHAEIVLVRQYVMESQKSSLNYQAEVWSLVTKTLKLPYGAS